MHNQIIKKLIPNLNMYAIVSFFADLLIRLLYLIPPILMQKIVDEYIPNKDSLSTIKTIMLFSLIPVIIAVFTTLYNYRLAIIGRNTGRRISNYGIKKLLNQPLSYFYDKNSVELAEYCSANAMKYTLLWISELPKLYASIIASVFAYIYVIRMSLSIGLGLLSYIPLLLVPSFYLAKKSQHLIKRVIINNGKSKQLISDTFKNVKFVKTMNLKDQLLFKIDQINKDTVSIWSKVTALDNLNGTWINNIVDNIFTGVVFAYGAIGVINGSFRIGTLIILLTYMPIIFIAVKKVSTSNFNYKSRLAEYEKLFEILELSNEIDTGSKPFSFKQHIKFEKVSFSYNQEIDVIKELDLTIVKGEWIGIIGKSGAGKTTFFDILLKLLNIDNGSITIDNVSHEEISSLDLRNGISKVAQNIFLFPGTIRENLLIVKPDATENELNEVIELVGLDQFINQLSNGLDTDIGEDGITISGGEKQRIGLARGILKGAQILLLDEVTGNVDRDSEIKIMNSICKVMKERELTIISISHKLEFLDFADRVLKMENGNLIPFNYKVMN